MIVIRLDSGEARNQLAEISRFIERPRAMLEASAGEVALQLRGHFLEKNSAGNKLGGRRTNFWSAISKQTQTGNVTDRSAEVVIGDPRFAQRLYGGTITAKTPWKGSGLLLLTIPVHPQAHGRRASKLAQELGIKLSFVGSAAGGVIGHFAKQAAEDEVYYACVPSVTQAPDPTALPPGEKLEEAAIEAAQDFLRREVEKQQDSQ